MLDRERSLLWTAADGGTAVSWREALEAVDALTTAGHSDWRLPTTAELASLYDPAQPGYVPVCTKSDLPVRVPPEFTLSCALYWSSDGDDDTATQFNFFHGQAKIARKRDDYGFGAYVLAVRDR